MTGALDPDQVVRFAAVPAPRPATGLAGLGYAEVVRPWGPPTVEPHPLCSPPWALVTPLEPTSERPVVAARRPVARPPRARGAAAGAKVVAAGLSVSSMALLVTTLVRADQRDRDRRLQEEVLRSTFPAAPAGLSTGDVAAGDGSSSADVTAPLDPGGPAALAAAVGPTVPTPATDPAASPAPSSTSEVSVPAAAVSADGVPTTVASAPAPVPATVPSATRPPLASAAARTTAPTAAPQPAAAAPSTTQAPKPTAPPSTKPSCRGSNCS